MDLLAQAKDKEYDLAICDPPYGIGIANNSVRQMHKKKGWDNAIPDEKYFGAFFAKTLSQIVWGGNYFPLPPTQNYIIWDKKQPEDFSLAMAELAWCSIQKPAKIFRYSVLTEQGKIHPTQKPVALYKWLLKNYAKEGDTILDTHGGSLSIAIACHDMGFKLTVIEQDEEYLEKAVKRLIKHQSQIQIF